MCCHQNTELPPGTQYKFSYFLYNTYNILIDIEHCASQCWSSLEVRFKFIVANSHGSTVSITDFYSFSREAPGSLISLRFSRFSKILLLVLKFCLLIKKIIFFVMPIPVNQQWWKIDTQLVSTAVVKPVGIWDGGRGAVAPPPRVLS